MRLRRVRFKDGRADLVVLRGPQDEEGDNRGSIVRNAKAIAELATDKAPLQGYVVLGLYADGCTSLGYRYDAEEAAMIPRALLPAWIAEVIRRDMIAGVEAREVFDQMFQWVE